MQETLITKLYKYLRENNPDILLALDEKSSVTSFLTERVNAVTNLLLQLQNEEKPAYVIEEICMDELTKEFRPSKYNYIVKILEEDFELTYQQFQRTGALVYEVANIIGYCEPVFQSLQFSEENEDNRQLRYTVTGIINEYLSK